MTVAALHQLRRRSRGLAARLTAVVVVVVVLAVVVAYPLITRDADIQPELLAGLVRVIVVIAVILLGVFVAGSGRALCLRPADPFDSRGPDSADPPGAFARPVRLPSDSATGSADSPAAAPDRTDRS